ncbi:TPA: hypothetical protein ACK3Q6_002690 [Burkholderia cepacia]|uniref:hypothetical protein n=1 Tax=Burkholderia TaxID=32008 RepID=UPI0005E993CB|nr:MULTISPECIES: hypothetical protein [Burkholderia]HDR9764137.1 hypothetical protein [Burkholderia cepacia ATCC 25416]MCA8361201.1 hypothetical protein [Burkholderia cepacia]MCW3498650.1 hypothetical protein [Burkholderia cenocepacia]MCW3506262.1 hypothetical protein [Burkholderia cenocepacia]MCW3513803.1 hypothetical protein [Burkholderia cenocepacia]
MTTTTAPLLYVSEDVGYFFFPHFNLKDLSIVCAYKANKKLSKAVVQGFTNSLDNLEKYDTRFEKIENKEE